MTIEDGIQDRMAMQAAGWYVAHREGELVGRECEAFMHWLRASPQHVAEYLAVCGIVADLPGAVGKSPEPLEKLRRDAAQPDAVAAFPSAPAAKRRPLRTTAILMAASLAVLGVLHALWLTQQSPRFTTAHGEQRTFQLPDSSVVRLNSNSSLRVDFSQETRDVTVLQGQAYFEVAPDRSHPFRVRTQSIVLTALGTAFDVYERDDGTRLTVTEGRVGIGARQQPVVAGQQVHISSTGEVRMKPQANLPRATAWLRQEIAFEGEAVADVAAEFNRYNQLEIRVDDARVGAVPISGVFQSYDVRSFIDFLDQLPQVKVVRKKGSAHIVAEQ